MKPFRDVHGKVLRPGDYVRNHTLSPVLREIRRIGVVIDSEKEGVLPFNESRYLTIRWFTAPWFKSKHDWVEDSYKHVYAEDQAPQVEKLGEEEYILHVLSEI